MMTTPDQHDKTKCKTTKGQSSDIIPEGDESQETAGAVYKLVTEGRAGVKSRFTHTETGQRIVHPFQQFVIVWYSYGDDGSYLGDEITDR